MQERFRWQGRFALQVHLGEEIGLTEISDLVSFELEEGQKLVTVCLDPFDSNKTLQRKFTANLPIACAGLLMMSCLKIIFCWTPKFYPQKNLNQ